MKYFKINYLDKDIMINFDNISLIVYDKSTEETTIYGNGLDGMLINTSKESYKQMVAYIKEYQK